MHDTGGFTSSSDTSSHTSDTSSHTSHTSHTSHSSADTSAGQYQVFQNPADPNSFSYSTSTGRSGGSPALPIVLGIVLVVAVLLPIIIMVVSFATA